MTKKDIVKKISEQVGLPQLKTKEVVQRTFEEIINTLVEEGRIELRNFGVFKVKERKARKARNPKTGNRVDVPAKFVVTFKPGKEMEERVRRMGQQQATATSGSGSGGPTPPVGAQSPAVPAASQPPAGQDSPGSQPSPATTPGPENPSS